MEVTLKLYRSLISYHKHALCDDISSERRFVIVVIFQYKCDMSIIYRCVICIRRTDSTANKVDFKNQLQL